MERKIMADSPLELIREGKKTGEIGYLAGEAR